MTIIMTPTTSSASGLCTLGDIKLRLGESQTSVDNLINQIITNISALFDSFCRRILLVTAASVTEYFTGEGLYLPLPRYPVVELTTVKEAYDYAFTTATALTLNTDYRIINGGLNGLLYRVNRQWCSLADSVQVVYRGGYCPAGVDPAAGEFALPADLREAAILQACLAFKRRDDLGLSGAGFDGGSFNKFADLELLPVVKDILKLYQQTIL